MKSKHLVFGLLLLSVALFCAGCGGGSCCSAGTKETARERAVATMRITRATFAVAGFGRRISRAASKGMGNRISRWLTAIHHTRDLPSPVSPVLDTDTNLYYTLTVNPDGSGRQDLFLDAALKQPGGAFTWTAPAWANGVENTYPATFQSVYQITGGDFAGEHGTIRITAADSTGNNGELEIDLTNSQGEHCVSDFTISNGVVSAKAHCTLPDDTTYDETYYTQPDDVIICTTTFPDGGSEDIQLNPDGSATQTVNDASGKIEATGDTQSNGNDTISYDDGSSETVNVDTNTDTTTDTTDDNNRAAKRNGIGRRTTPPLRRRLR